MCIRDRKYAVDALRDAPDMELAGIVRRPGSEAVHGIKTVSDVEDVYKRQVRCH